jgi:hypothetical protein
MNTSLLITDRNIAEGGGIARPNGVIRADVCLDLFLPDLQSFRRGFFWSKPKEHKKEAAALPVILFIFQAGKKPAIGMLAGEYERGVATTNSADNE